MKSRVWKAAVGVLLGAILVSSTALGQLGATVPNWAVPSHHGAMTTMGDVTEMLPFVGVTPCRIVDTRGPAGPFGGPAIAGGTSRNFLLPSGPCAGLPTTVAAYSLNVTATNTTGPGFFKIWPQGGTEPLVSTLNYVAGQTIANAAIVPTGTGGGITVKAGVSTADLIIDVNGYFSETAGVNTTLRVEAGNAGNASITAINPTGTGVFAQGEFGGIEGLSTALSGIVGIGVFGRVLSSAADSAGVKGEDDTAPFPAPTYSPAGVRGESASNYGLLGISRNQGVAGSLVDFSSTELAYGLLGFNPGTAYGVYSGGNFGGTGAKYFVEPHPTDPAMVIRYVCLEGPESGTYFRGSAQILNGTAVIDVPEDFRIVSDAEGLTVQLTPVGAPASMYVVSEDLNQIVVRSNSDVRFHYLVNGVRRAFKDHQAIALGLEFMPRSASDRVPAYLTKEARARLIANGTYNPDGTVNMETAERVGWARIWAERKAAAEQAAKESAARAADHEQQGQQQQQE